MKPCPVCGEQIQDVAVKCRYCGEIFDPAIKKQRRRAKSRGGAPWWKKMLLGLVYWVVFYFVACFVAGAIAGARAGAQNPGNPQRASEEGAKAGAQVVQEYAAIFLLGSGALAIAGAAFGVLPGTRGDD